MISNFEQQNKRKLPSIRHLFVLLKTLSRLTEQRNLTEMWFAVCDSLGVLLWYFEIRKMKFSNTLLAIRHWNGNHIWLEMIKSLHSKYYAWCMRREYITNANFNVIILCCEPLVSLIMYLLHSHYHDNGNEILDFGCDIK